MVVEYTVWKETMTSTSLCQELGMPSTCGISGMHAKETRYMYDNPTASQREYLLDFLEIFI